LICCVARIDLDVITIFCFCSARGWFSAVRLGKAASCVARICSDVTGFLVGRFVWLIGDRSWLGVMVVYLLMLADIRGVYSEARVLGKFGSTRGTRIDLNVMTIFTRHGLPKRHPVSLGSVLMSRVCWLAALFA
jgi:hypothetical protein